MKRLLSVLCLLVFAACGNHPSATPNAGDSTGSVDELAQNDNQDHPRDPTETETAPNWRYAQPPTGDEQNRDAEPKHKSERYSFDERPAAEPRAERGPPPAPTTAPSANKSGKDLGGSGSAEAESRGRAYDKSDGDARRSVSKPTDDRPGLGTTWGETRYSSVTEVRFERDSDGPSYTATMHYNDQRGANALAGGSSYSRSATMGLGSALTMSIRDEYGNNLSAYRGNGRTVAIGENGQRYTIVIDNNTNERFEVVLSVDGLDVLDGREAGYGKRGYLIDAYGHLEVEGFRQSDDAVASFRFGSVRDSYAARTGQARNVGVIGAAAFGERGYRARLAAYQDRLNALRYNNGDIERRRNADPFPGKYATPPQWTVVR